MCQISVPKSRAFSSLLPLWGTMPDKMAPALFAGFQVRAPSSANDGARRLPDVTWYKPYLGAAGTMILGPSSLLSITAIFVSEAPVRTPMDLRSLPNSSSCNSIRPSRCVCWNAAHPMTASSGRVPAKTPAATWRAACRAADVTTTVYFKDG